MGVCVSASVPVLANFSCTSDILDVTMFITRSLKNFAF